MNDTTNLPSGRFVLRIEPELHLALRKAAEEAGMSLNAYCAGKLTAPGTALTGPGADAVKRAAGVTGEALRGVVAFGSWARDAMTASSDVDLLVVVDEDTLLRRELYRRWDEAPLRWDSHRVEPHFVHLPSRAEEVSGLWAEAAVDGVVLFDPGLDVSRRLVEIRKEIAAGRMVREESHGHPYWVRAA